MKDKWIVGIDPGLDGAVVLLSPEGAIDQWWDTPVTPKVKGTKRVLLEVEARSILVRALERAAFAGPHALIVAIERIGAMPGVDPATGDRTRTMGAASAFNMGLGWGLWRGITVGLGLPYVLVAPQSWKRLYGVPGKQQGGDSRVVAQQRFPEFGSQLTRLKDHGRADAALIALFVRERGER